MADRGRENESCRATQALDLRNSMSYGDAVEWLRRNVVQRNTVGRDVLQLNATLPGGMVALYMDPRNHYIMGFRGADAAYLLKDDNTAAFKSALEAELRQTKIEILEWLGADHGLGGLRTFTRKSSGMEGRVFARKNLDAAPKLAEYSSRTNRIDGEQVRTSLSLLVCMLSESARIPMMEIEFTYRFYYGHAVQADDAVQSYADAKYIIELATRTFPRDTRPMAIERTRKRAVELRIVLDRLGSQLNRGDGAELIAQVLTGSVPQARPTAHAMNQFREMCREMKLDKPDAINLLLNKFGNEGALRAAMMGVVIPDIGKEV